MSEHFDELARELELLHFSKVESQIYLSLLGRSPQNGSQIARDLGTVRSSVYHALDGLRSRGVIFLVPGSSSTYLPEDPQVLMEKLKGNFVSTANKLSKRLASLHKAPETEAVLNIHGNELFISKVRQVLLEAREEVYLNVCMDLHDFRVELETLKRRGVRVLVFSFEKLSAADLPMELYQHGLNAPGTGENRLMLVADMETALVGTAQPGEEFFGTFSRNRLLVRLVAEHIHHDIYLLRLREKTGIDPVSPDILLGTKLESSNK